jgi:hypothetical protein
MNARLLVTTAILTILSGSGSHALAQLPAAPTGSTPLEIARADFSAKVLSASRQLNEQYVRALTKLEDELAAERNYEEALTVHSRIADLQKVLLRSPAMELGTPIPLATSSAQLSGVILDSGYLTRWRTASSHAEWTLQKVTPGTYTIEISYLITSDVDAPPPASVTETVFRFQEVSLLASFTQFRDVILKHSEELRTFTEVRTEPITFTRPTLTLRLEGVKTTTGDLIRIGGIKLIPVESAPPSPPAPIVEVTLDGQMELESLRQIFIKRLETARGPLLSAYEAKLKTLQAQPNIMADAELSEYITAEQKRIASAPALNARDGKKGPLDKLPSPSLEGFEDISGALWVSDPENTAERFKVIHEGREFWIKLAWVNSPPSTTAKPGELHSAAKAFGIAEDDALSIGRIAAEYARGHLEGKPLRLLVRTQRNDKKEAAPALVFLDGTGFFQAMLLDYGFAAYAPLEGNAQKSLIEMALMKMLQERQEKAKTKSPPAGAWAFRGDQSPKP